MTNLQIYLELIPIIKHSLIAGFFLGCLSGAISIFVVMRNLAFAVHGIAELSFTGSAVALLFGFNLISGSVFGSFLASLFFGIINNTKTKQKNSFIGTIMPFCLGIGVFCLSLYKGHISSKFALLTGQLIFIHKQQLNILIFASFMILIILFIIWKPLSFASIDPIIAEARGVPIKFLSILFMSLVGISTALLIQIVGPLLALSLLITPAASSMKISNSLVKILFLSMLFATSSIIGGILLSLIGKIPPSPYITTISFFIYLICHYYESAKMRKAVTIL